MLNVLLKQLIPIAKPFIESGQIDMFVENFKAESIKKNKVVLQENQSVEIMFTGGKDKKTQASIVVMDKKEVLVIIESVPLSDLILKIINTL
jgi:hypothetical protein